jgi:hypothetical protein
VLANTERENHRQCCELIGANNCGVSVGMSIQWYTPEDLRAAVRRAVAPADVVLDIGSGIMPQPLFIPRVHICCEPFLSYLSRLQEKTRLTRHRFVYLQMGWQEVVNSLPPGSVDTAILVDVVEHLEKDVALKLLEQTVRLVRRQVLVSTPLGFCRQHYEPGETDAWGMDGVIWQEHRSGWDVSDFDDRWTILACREYHHVNGKDEKLDPPVGMFWAIYNAERPYVKPPFRRLRTAVASSWREFLDRMDWNFFTEKSA